MTTQGLAHAVPEADDATVIQLSRDEPEHFTVLFRRHAPHIQRYVVRRLGADAADDIVAETFLLAFRQRDSYDLARADARPWLYGIATKLIRPPPPGRNPVVSRAGPDRGRSGH